MASEIEAVSFTRPNVCFCHLQLRLKIISVTGYSVDIRELAFITPYLTNLNNWASDVL